MKVGDLVNFHSESWVFRHAGARYESPGIIISCSDPINNNVVARIYWADGKITREHSSFLRPFDDRDTE